MRILFLLLASTALSISAEVLSWKVQLIQFASDGLDTPGLVRMKNPPEESPFFKKGDELWNMGDFVPEYGEKLGTPTEWAVWNATSGRVVAKGSWVALKELQRMIGADHFPRQCRVKVELIRVPEDGSPPDESSIPASSLSLASRSGKKAHSTISNDDGAIDFSVEPTLSVDNTLADVRLLISASLHDSPTVKINTSAALLDGSSIWIARDFDGKSGLDVRISLNAELPDGTRFADATQIQHEKEILPYPKASNSGQVKLDKNFWLTWERSPLSSLDGFLNGPSQEEIDPFAETGRKIFAFEGIKELPIPAPLARFFSASYFDIKNRLKGLGLEFSEGGIVGYDPWTQTVFIYSSDKAEHDDFQKLFSFYFSEIPSAIVISSRGTRQMRLVCWSGTKASLKSTDPESKTLRYLEIEPTMGETESIFDLRLVYEEKSGEKVLKSLNTSATLEAQKFLPLMETDSTGSALEFKAEKLDLH